MTALNFPSSPTNGQVYGDYTYDSTAGVWRATTLQPIAATVSDVPPANPKNGDTWVYAAEGTMFVYYADGTSSQWIEVRQNATESSGNFSGYVRIAATADVTLTSTDHGLQIGDSAGQNLAIDNNEIISRAAGVAGTLHLQAEGGTVAMLQNVAGTVDINNGKASFDTTGRLKFGTNVMPAFHATGLTTQAWTGVAVFTKLAMTSVVTNSGSHYDGVTNSRFTAPIAGLYMFYATITQSTAVGGPEFKFYKNGAAIAQGAITYTTAYITSGNTVILSLAANDYVEIWVQNNNATTVTIDRTRCSFGGRLIG